MKKLYVFVEGSDDERFVRYYFKNRDVQIIQYANMPYKEFGNLVQTISHTSNADYVVLADADGATIEAKKSKFIKRRPKCSSSKVFISQHEIESWYIAGLNNSNSIKYKVKNISCTDTFSKEEFDKLIPKGFTSISFKVEILKLFDVDLAKSRNTSFEIFASANKRERAL